METLLASAGALSIFGSVFGFLLDGGFTGFGLLLLGLLAFGLARLFDLLSDVLEALGRFEKVNGNPGRNPCIPASGNKVGSDSVSDSGPVRR